tara:strand:+ start:1743 stop:4478 length:2736 start_codon:yes stop_codon:yes gene_type:complete
MADRLDLLEMEDFPIITNPEEEDTSSGGFRIEGAFQNFFTPREISIQDYSSRFVDFTRETLASTGIGVDRPIDEDDDKEDAVAPETGIVRADGGDDPVDDGPAFTGEMSINIDTVGTSAGGNADEINIFDMNTVGFQTPFEFKATQEAYSNDRSGLFGMDNIGRAAAGGAYLLDAGLFGSAVASIATGTEVKNPFGMTTFRPSGGFGIIADVLHNRQSQALMEVQSAHAAGLNQKGFALTIGSSGLVRAPGKYGYLGNLGPYSNEQLHRIEAFQKGFDPRTFDPRKETGKYIVDEGGVITGGMSFYTANGSFYNGATGQTSAQGSLSDLNNLASATGLTGGLTGTARTALDGVRSGKYESLHDAIKALGGNPAGIKTMQDAIKAGLVTSGRGVKLSGGKLPGGTTIAQKIVEQETGRTKDINELKKTAKEKYNIVGITSAKALESQIAARQTEMDVAAARYGFDVGSRTYSQVMDKAKAEQQAIDLAKKAAEEAAAQNRTLQFGYQDSNDSGGGTVSTPTGGGNFVSESFEDYQSRDYHDFATGGFVGMAIGGQMAGGMSSGFVDRPPSQVSEEQTVADNVETKMPEGAFVINAAAVEFAGEEDIKKMLNDAQKEAVRRGITIDNSENSAKLIDVAISRGEVTVAPYLARIIGYDRLNKINNRGKPETKERLQEAAQGGMLGMANGGSIYDYEDPIILDEVKRKMEQMISSAQQQGMNIESYYDLDPYGLLDEEELRQAKENIDQFTKKENIDPIVFGPFFGTDDFMGSGPAANVPRTPSLLNLFITAEEIAHASGSGKNFQSLASQPGMTDEEARYNEELRAKRIAYETVRGLLPKGERTVQHTYDNYGHQFLEHIRQTTPKELQSQVIASMAEKYPELQDLIDSEERIARSQRAKQTFERKASGGFINR